MEWNWSRAILKDLVFKENIEKVLCGQSLGYPSWDFDVEVLLSCSLGEYLLEFVHQVLVLALQVVYHLIFILNVPLEFPDLVLVGVDFVVLNVLEFFDLSLASTFLAFSLALHQGVVLILFCLPPCQVLLALPPEISLGWLKMGNLFVAFLDLDFLEPDGFPEFGNKRVLFGVFFLKSLDFAFELFGPEVIYFLNIIKFLNKTKSTDPAFLVSLSS